MDGDAHLHIYLPSAPLIVLLSDLKNAAEALQMLFDGRNDGKLIVRIDPSASASEATLLSIRGQPSKL